MPESKLPTDVAVLQGLVHELLGTNHQQTRRIGHLEHQLDQLLKRLYGPRADKLHPDQGSLFGDLPPEPTPPPVVIPLEIKPESKSKGHGRKSLPEDLRRETVVVDIPEAEKLAVGGTWVKIGEEASEKLDYTPSSLFVRRIVRPKYVVRFDTKSVEAKPDAMMIAELPPEAMPKCKATPGLIADIIISKLVDHRVQGEAVHEMRVGLSRSGCRTRSQTAEELRRLRAVVGSVFGNGVA